MFQTLFEFALRSNRLPWRDAISAMEVMLIRDGSISRVAMTEAMTKAFGGSDASGAWSPKLGYDCAEGAMVAYLRRLGISPNAPLPENLRDFDRALPTQTRRVGRTETYQQYSTPVSIGWLAARAAKIAPRELCLEPSGGTGLLAVHAANAGARLGLNEIDEERRQILGMLDVTSSLDAYNIGATYEGERPSVVLMNPPFTVNAVSGEHSSAVGFHHIEQALSLLRPGGRLVAIVGESLALDHEYFTRLTKHATLISAISLCHSAFAKMGVHYATQLLVIDAFKSFEKPHILASGATLAETVAFIDALPGRRKLEVVAAAAPTTRANVARAISNAKKRLVAIVQRATEPAAPVQYDVLPARDSGVIADSVFEAYRPGRIAFRDAKPHPTALVESVALASVNPPDPTYVPMLPPDLVREGLFSEAQLEAIVYAGGAHSTTIRVPDEREEHMGEFQNMRRALMLGDGGGVGKSNTIIGIILDNFARGRKKALWLSDRQSLEQDAVRYWAALGGDPNALANANRFPLGTEIGLAEGVLFSTYSTLRSASRTLDRTRLQQFIEWLGADFDGIILLDEAHGLQNAATGKGTFGRIGASQQGALALELQMRLPDARVVYSSATAATRLDALAYAPRLGLWGPDTDFGTREKFMSRMDAGGLAAMEVVCRDLKAMGLYFARTLSMDGVTYERLTHTLTNHQREHYAVYCTAWQTISKSMDAAMVANNLMDANGKALNGRSKGAVLSVFESAKQRFFSNVLISLSLQTALEDAHKRLAAGESVIFQLTTTNEATQERALTFKPNDVELDDLDMSPRDLLLTYLRSSFPTTLFEIYEDQNGEKKSRPVLDAKDNEVENPEAVAMRDDLIEQITNLVVQDGALDLILEEFGHENVAEITGRKRRLVRKLMDGEMRRVIEARPSGAIVSETQAFMDGKKRILVFSGAGDTGRSYHSDLQAQNQERRNHYVLEPGWRAERTLQGMFRSHRTNQRVAPHYIIVPTDVPAQARFTSTIARRLDQLGAMTRGQRDATSAGLYSAAENLESDYAKEALKTLVYDIAKGNVAAISCEAFMSETGLRVRGGDGAVDDSKVTVPRFLNRLLAVNLERQAILLDEFLRRISERVEDAVQRGTYDAGVETIRPVALRKLTSDTLAVCMRTGAVTSLVKLERDDLEENTTYYNVLSRVNAYRMINGKKSAYFARNNEGEVMAILAFTSISDAGRITTKYRTISPLGKPQIAEYTPYATPIKDENAADAWTVGAELAATQTRSFYIVTGALLPVWERLSGTQPRVYRMKTDDGERILGRVLEDVSVPNIMRAFGVTKNAWDDADMISQIRRGFVHRFSRYFTAKLSRVNGAGRIEITTDDPYRSNLQTYGLLREKINSRIRYFIPTGENEQAIFETVRGALQEIAA